MSFWVINLLTALASFAIAGLSGIFLVPFLHKIKFGQPIKTKDGPQWHAKKQGTPTMGGFMFIISTIITSIGGYWIYRLNSGIDVTDSESFHPFYRMLSCVVFAALFGLIGFIDDYTKVARKDNDGLSPMQKIALQLVFSVVFLFAIFTVCCSILKEYEMTYFTMALAGGCLGFLLWNLNPAKCFMGDTGSMFLGASVTGVSLILHKHLLMLLVAMVYIIEALSVVIQVSYFKYTKKKTGEGKRIFKMTPIHHHFEMSGFSEYKIVITFSITGIIFGILGILTLLAF